MENLEEIIAEIETMSSADLVQLNNDYCYAAGYGDDVIYSNDEEFFTENFSNPLQAVRAAIQGAYSYHDKYVRFDGYANLVSMDEIDVEELADSVQNIAEYVMENPKEFTYNFS